MELQIGCYLTREEAVSLAAYATEHELSRPKLCGLLVLREALRQRLYHLKGRYNGCERQKDATRVTARISNMEVKSIFLESARRCGLGSDEAAAIVFRAELDEHWLASALRT